MGWKGINIEIDPDNYAELAENRKDDIANVQAAVCSETERVHYATGEAKGSGGVWELATETHHTMQWPGKTLYDTIPIKCTPLQSILDRVLNNRLKHHFDFATVDLEGAELSALLGIDFNRITFGIIIVEKSEQESTNHKIDDLLRSKGYIVVHAANRCSHRNVWYIHEDFERIYEHLWN